MAAGPKAANHIPNDNAVKQVQRAWLTCHAQNYLHSASNQIMLVGMKPAPEDIQDMVQALFTVTMGLERARRRNPGASNLALLQLIAAREGSRPSGLVAELGLHQSTITRQLQSLEEAGHVTLRADPDDRRSYLITLTENGRSELDRLMELGLDRLALFVADWSAEEVRTLTRLLMKFEDSKATVARRERRPHGRRWRAKEANHESRDTG